MPAARRTPTGTSTYSTLPVSALMRPTQWGGPVCVPQRSLLLVTVRNQTYPLATTLECQSGTTCIIPLYSQSGSMLTLTLDSVSYLFPVAFQRRMSTSLDSDQPCASLPVMMSRTVMISFGGSVNQ